MSFYIDWVQNIAQFLGSKCFTGFGVLGVERLIASRNFGIFTLPTRLTTSKGGKGWEKETINGGPKKKNLNIKEQPILISMSSISSVKYKFSL